MFEDTFTMDMLSNPTKLAKATIDEMEATDTTGLTIVQDPNNGFIMQMAANMAVFSKFSEKVDYASSFYYSQRARNSEQLYAHLSEFDYVKLMASPATVPFLFEMDKNWIIRNSVYFDSNYNKIQIPSTSYITMGGRIYSMYYPIDIFVNRNTGGVTAFYNEDVTNSLYTLSSNMLKDVREYTKDGITYFQIQFDMFLFNRRVDTLTVSSDQGFIKTYTYDDQFYAAKVFYQNASLQWVELAYSLSTINYDFTRPTALISVMNDTSEVKIEIPQIYFDNNLVSQKLKVELYTTEGYVNYSLTSSDVAGLTANFDTASSSFANPLAQMPTWTLVPTIIDIEGGSNADTYDQIRDAVVNQRLYDRAPITPSEVTEAFRKAGFSPIKVTDNLTDRMYYASNTLIDSNKMVIPTFTGSILISGDSLNGNPETIVKYTDGYYTILPTTTFKIVNNSLTCVPLSDGEVNSFRLMTREDQVAELNTGSHIRQPFHITLKTDAKSPSARVFNLLAPEVLALSFIRENPHSAPQMSAISVGAFHQNDGTGGYKLLFSVQRSSNIEQADITNFRVLLTCKTKIGEVVYLPASYVAAAADGTDTWQITLATNYHLSNDNYITVMMYNTSNVLAAVEIPLEQTFTILTSFLSSFDTTIPADSVLNGLLPFVFSTSQIVMAEQQLVVRLGKSMSDQVYSGVNTTWGTDVYEIATANTYYTTHVPIFQTNETGVIETRLSDTNDVKVVLLYPQDSTPPSPDDITITTTAATAVSSSHAVLTVDDVTGLLVGMKIRGPNIPVSSVIENIAGLNVTISNPLTNDVTSGSQLVVTNVNKLLRTSIEQASAGNLITVASTADLVPGLSVFGFDIPAGSVISTIPDATTFTISHPTTTVVANNTLLTIVNKTAHGVVKIAKGDVVTDSTGTPVVLESAQNQYRIPAIMFDGRLFGSEDPTDQLVVTTIASKLQNYANQIYTMAAGLTENSNIFYKPVRTMGLATFGIGNSDTIEMSLELSFSFKVYVDEAVYNNSTITTTLESSIYSIVNDEIQNATISVSDIANTLKTKLGTSVIAVESDGINGNKDLRLIALEEAGATPSIEHKLVLQADGSITRKPNITVTFIPKPETADEIVYNNL